MNNRVTHLNGTFPVGDKPVKMNKFKKVNQGNLHAGWKLINFLPNVRKFIIDISGWDKLFKKHGILKREAPSFKFKYHRNSSMNRYISHQFRRMDKNRNNPLLFWRIGMRLVRKSNIFFVMALNHVFPKWHRDMKLSSVIRLAIATRRIANTKEEKLDFKRVYISKANGKIRPLGVPTPSWRIYLHMMNVILTFYYESTGKFREAQHGFRPGRGTMSAWKEILSKVINSRDIFEFDLKGFFDSINLDYIANQMIKDQIPVNIVQLFYVINTSACQIKPPYLLNEFEHMMKKLLNQGDFRSIVRAPRPISYMYRVKGVPQGAPTSPTLSLLGLHESVLDRPNIKTLMYADDGVYYGDLKDTPLITPNSGMVSANINFNLSKSSWVKRNGIWLKPLKFLGMVYDGTTDTLKSQTRKGNELIFDKEQLMKEFDDREWRKDTISKIQENLYYPDGKERNKERRDKYTFLDMVSSKLFGFIQSRLYQGSWNLDNYEQDFFLSFKPKSYCAYSMKLRHGLGEKLTVFNSSTFASEWLVKKLSKVKALKTL